MMLKVGQLFAGIHYDDYFPGSHQGTEGISDMTAMQALRDLSAQTGKFRHGEYPDLMADRLSISVVGLGYVGAVTLGCLANLGFLMSGAGIVEKRANAINADRSTIEEEGL